MTYAFSFSTSYTVVAYNRVHYESIEIQLRISSGFFFLHVINCSPTNIFYNTMPGYGLLMMTHKCKFMQSGSGSLFYIGIRLAIKIKV